jgi:HK97 family phage major capsid protein
MFDWRDLIALKWSVPLQFHPGGTFWCNQRTWALALTMSDAVGRPLMIQDPTEPSKFSINGSPVIIVNTLPDVAPGALPWAFGNWKEAYMLANRKAVTMQQDAYSAGFCTLWKWEARVGGGVLCPNAARFLRIR